jgi:hypothetical protein
MPGKRLLFTALVAVLAGFAGYGAWQLFEARAQASCQVCRRAIHGGSKTVAIVAGKQEVFCCPACALAQARQSGANLRVLSLSDFSSGQALRPDQAWVVRGSDVSPCHAPEARLTPDKHPLERAFDRCEPSLLAFASAEAARAFARDHGGAVLPFAELQAEAR